MKIFVQSRRDGFRRCGVAHSAKGREFPEGTFTDEEIDILQNDPDIMIVSGVPEDDELDVDTGTNGVPGQDEDQKPDKADPGHAAMMVAVCIAIEDGNTTKAGAPEVGTMEEILGENITAAERDAAWAAWKKEHEA